MRKKGKVEGEKEEGEGKNDSIKGFSRVHLSDKPNFCRFSRPKVKAMRQNGEHRSCDDILQNKEKVANISTTSIFSRTTES